MDSTLRSLFAMMFSRDFVLDEARRLGAIRRVRELHPFDVLLALMSCALGDEQRSIATARRQLLRLTGYVPEESSFYERLTPGFVSLAWLLFLRTVAHGNRARRKQLARALGLHVRDVRAVDSTQGSLPRRAAQALPSTDSHLGGFKLTVALSVLEDSIVSARLTDARQHDRKAFELPADVRGVLWLMDRGYCDHRLFAAIDAGGGFFLTRLKASSIPTVRMIRSGLGRAHLGQKLDGELPYRGVVDVDCAFRVTGQQTRLFRVVSIAVLARHHGRQTQEYLWLVTNLPPHRVSAEAVATIYRLRWMIESFFKTLKTVGRLDQVRSGNPAIVSIFVAATLLGMALTQAVSAAMRAEHPDCEPSPQRVFALLLASLPDIIAARGTPAYSSILRRFITALWREGVNPNPGRPYAWRRHAAALTQ
jgi:putative transposase